MESCLPPDSMEIVLARNSEVLLCTSKAYERDGWMHPDALMHR